MYSFFFLMIAACGNKEDSTSENANSESTDTSMESTSEPTSEPTSEENSEPTSEVSSESTSEPTSEPTSEANTEVQDDFCSFFEGTCGTWPYQSSCEEWWLSYEAGTYDQIGNPIDTVGATQSCYEYHLHQAASMTEQSEIDMYCTYAIGGSDESGNAPCGDSEPSNIDPAESFCDTFYATCDEWPNVHVDCTEWFAAAESGTPGDTTGATQACYQHHLYMATTMTNVSDVERFCDYAIGIMDDHGNDPCDN